MSEKTTLFDVCVEKAHFQIILSKIRQPRDPRGMVVIVRDGKVLTGGEEIKEQEAQSAVPRGTNLLSGWLKSSRS